jgi:hypothetical protein
MSTLTAGHVHTPLVFLYLFFALGTGLCIQFDPLCAVFLCVAQTVEPGLKQLAINWLVTIFKTLKTVLFSALVASEIPQGFSSSLLHY